MPRREEMVDSGVRSRKTCMRAMTIGVWAGRRWRVFLVLRIGSPFRACSAAPWPRRVSSKYGEYDFAHPPRPRSRNPAPYPGTDFQSVALVLAEANCHMALVKPPVHDLHECVR